MTIRINTFSPLSSRFAPETRWGNFWSLGTSWRIDRESFMASTANWLSALTLKMSYGAQGNDNLGTYYASKGLYAIVSNLGENALVSDRMATPNLKWERNLIKKSFSLYRTLTSALISHCLTTVFPVRSTSLRVVPKTYFIPVRSLLP